ncbi:energy transducer TonB [Dyella terrae]|nr:energy transducer TonB [Dyella terrae]
MRSIAVAVMLALVSGCAMDAPMRTSGPMLTFSPPGEGHVAQGYNSPYSIPWPRGNDGSLLAGETVLIVLINAQGNVETVKVEATSGYPLLDMAAIEGVRRWHFEPGIRQGVAAKGYARIPVMMDPKNQWRMKEPMPATLINPPGKKTAWGPLGQPRSTSE